MTGYNNYDVAETLDAIKASKERIDAALLTKPVGLWDSGNISEMIEAEELHIDYLYQKLGVMGL